MTDNGRWGLVALSLAAIMLTFAASLAVGDQIYGWEQVRAAFSDTPGEATIIIREVRIPRAFLAMVVGLALAVAGSLTQTLTRNPLADPGLLGVTAGAGFAVSIGAALGLAGGQFQQMVWSFLFNRWCGPSSEQRSPQPRSTSLGGKRRCGWCWPGSRSAR